MEGAVPALFSMRLEWTVRGRLVPDVNDEREVPLWSWIPPITRGTEYCRHMSGDMNLEPLIGAFTV